ncbi:bifunctional Importin repeat 4/Armadillo-like helical/Armadillo-type fold/Importin beta family [Babesia duncani]|uniref:Bifunctional Importin repeat 4/Armadillo-like helical/Armadillo-type fold/Importin beta family n=1 Tax=Babesia duncani TaxID=323732 RepID=A0AAD9UPU9_9APIC|nr:bifunctional Importin repeat 4/Armadillo-like helical/Armadillo-type fold/Importin beta family [Babesia duncani]
MAQLQSNEAFLTLLDALASTDKATRTDADTKINALKKNDLNGILRSTLATMCSNVKEELRLQSVILLRLLLDVSRAGETARNTWKMVNADVKAQIKSTLLQVLHANVHHAIRRNVCDTIADLCAACLEDNEWPELLYSTLQQIQNEDVTFKRSGLKLLGDCFIFFSESLSQHVNDVVVLIKNSLMHANASVRTEAICTIANAIEEDVVNMCQLLVDTTPLIIEHLNQLSHSNNPSARDELERSLAGIIMIVDYNAKMLKTHLVPFFNCLVDIAQSDGQNQVIDQEIRCMAIEALVTLPEKRPKMALSIPNFGPRLISCLMNCMLDIQDDSYSEWLATGDDDEDVQRLYDAGEEGLDRMGRAFEYMDDCSFMDWILSAASQYIQQPHWQHVFVGIMAISQTVEYLDEEELEERMGPIIQIMLDKLKDADFRVRFAACQTLGQVALDHQPYVQLNFYDTVIPALIATFDDQSPRVQSHALSAFINYAEEVQKLHLLPFADIICQRLLSKINVNVQRSVREQAITSIAVTAGVLEEHFMKYYQTVVPLMKEIIAKCTGKEERTCRGKAIECISITGMSIGRDVFLNDGIECMNALIQIMQEPALEDDPVREYIDEAIGRLCTALGPNFKPFLPTIVPLLLKNLESNATDGVGDMTCYLGQDGSGGGLSTSLVEEQERTLVLLASIVEELVHDYDEFVAPTAKVLMPILSLVLTAELKQKALNAMAHLINAKKTHIQMHSGPKDMLLDIVLNTVDRVVTSMQKADRSEEVQGGLDVPVDVLSASAEGLFKCIDYAGPGVFSPQALTAISDKLLVILNQSSKIKQIYKRAKANKNLDPDEVLALEEDEEAEQSFRSSILEIFGVFMKHHPQEFMAAGCHEKCLQFVMFNLESSNCPDDIAVALYLCDNMIEFLQDKVVPMYNMFLGHILKHACNKNANVRQSAAFGLSLLARIPQFGPMAAEAARTLQNALGMHFPKSQKDQQAATDNVVAALGDLVRHHSSVLPDSKVLLDLWIKNLPLKQDESEGRRVHAELMELVTQSNPAILGENGANLPQLSRIFISIYETDFSSTELNSLIVQFLKHLGESFLVTLAPSLTKRLQRQLKIIAKAMNHS